MGIQNHHHVLGVKIVFFFFHIENLAKFNPQQKAKLVQFTLEI
jgi:hypothetical protein